MVSLQELGLRDLVVVLGRLGAVCVTLWLGWAGLAVLSNSLISLQSPRTIAKVDVHQDPPIDAPVALSLEGAWSFAGFPLQLSLSPTFGSAPIDPVDFATENSQTADGLFLSVEHINLLEQVLNVAGESMDFESGLTCHVFGDVRLQVLVVTRRTGYRVELMGGSISRLTDRAEGTWETYEFSSGNAELKSRSLFPSHLGIKPFATRFNAQREPLMELGIADTEASESLVAASATNASGIEHRIIAKLGADNVLIAASALSH